MIQSKCLQRFSLNLCKNTRAPVAQHLTRIQKTKVQILAGSQCLLSLLSIKSLCFTNTQNSGAWSERLQTRSFRWGPHTVRGHGGKAWEQGWCQPPSPKWTPRGNLTASEAPLCGMCGNYVIHAQVYTALETSTLGSNGGFCFTPLYIKRAQFKPIFGTQPTDVCTQWNEHYVAVAIENPSNGVYWNTPRALNYWQQATLVILH